MKKTTKKLMFGSLGLLALLAVLLLSVKHAAYERRVNVSANTPENVSTEVNDDTLGANPLQSAADKMGLDELDKKIKENVNKFLVSEKENLARRQRELPLMPGRTETPLKHYPVKTTDANLDALPDMGVDYYKDAKGLIVYDFRETLEKPALNDDQNYLGVLKREWLIAEAEDAYVVKLTEEYDQYADGTLTLKGSEEYVADSLIARVSPEHSLLDFKAAVEGIGFRINEVLLTTDKGYSYVVINTPEATLDSFEEGVALLEYQGMCHLIEPNNVQHLSANTKEPNDPVYQDWQDVDYGAINAPAAWYHNTGSSSTIVAVVDTGVFGYHPDLKNNMWWNGGSDNGNANWGVWTYNGAMQTEGIELWDTDGHGTHVAGIIGAVGNNSNMVTGVNWRCKIIGVKGTAFVGGSMAISDTVKGWEWAANRGAKVINYSFGSAGAISTLEKDAATMLKSKDVVLVCSAGNDGTNNDSVGSSPANLTLSHDNCVSVAATNMASELASFSNYGSNSVSIAAPGVAIMSTVAFLDGEDYIYGIVAYNGTSMAAPMVTGAVTLLRSHFPNESYSQILNRLYTNAKTLSFLSGKVKGSRYLNLGASIASGVFPPTVAATQGTLDGQVKVTWNTVSGATHYCVYYSTSSTGTKQSLSGWKTGTSYTHTGLIAGKNYYYWVKAATSSSGAGASEYSNMATGWPKPEESKQYPDSWDPDDDTVGGATALSVTTTKAVTGRHGLVNLEDDATYEQDQDDYYKFTVSSSNVGKMHFFKSNTEGGSAYATKDMRAFVVDSDGYILAMGDDIEADAEEPYDGNYDFLVGFEPETAGTYYLLVRAWGETEKIFYTLEYQIGGYELEPTHMEQEIPQNGGEVVITLTDEDGVVPWLFTNSNRPSWITKITAKVPGKTVDMTNAGDYTLTFEGEGTLTFTVAPNTTTTARQWVEGFTVSINSGYYSIDFYQEAGSVAAPSNVTATKGTYENKVLISWNTVSGASYYRVFRADSASGTPQPINTSTWQSSTSFYDSTVTAGKEYWYYVKASTSVNGAAPSVFSSSAVGYAGVLPGTKFKLTVNSGTGSGEYAPGTTVTIEANPAPVGQEFLKWTGYVSAVKDVNKASTTVTMPNQNITLTATYAVEAIEESPFKDDELVKYPNNPLTRLYVSVTINGHKPTENDWIAAYCGNEKRAEAKLGSDATLLKINWAKTGETLQFRVYESSTKTYYDCTTTILTATSFPYTKDEPLELEVGDVDPYGEPIKYPNVPQKRAYVTAELYEVPAGVGDIIVVFCGNELRGKTRIKSGEANTLVKINCAKASGEVLEFKVFDVDYPAVVDEEGNVTEYGKQFDATITIGSGEPAESYTTTSASAIGSTSLPAKLIVSSTKRTELKLQMGWAAFSLNVIPEESGLEAIFGDVFADVLEIQDLEGNLYVPGEFDEITEILPATQYWVNLKSSANVNVIGDECKLDDYEFELIGNGGVSSVPYILQEPSDPKATFESIIGNSTYKLDHIVGSGGGVYYPNDPTSTNTLTVLKPGEVYWFFAKPDSGSMTFSYSNVTAQSLSKALNVLASQEALPGYWTEGNPYQDSAVATRHQFKLNISYYGETFPRGNVNLLVAAFTEIDGVKYRVSAAGGSSPEFNVDINNPMQNGVYVSLDVSHGLNPDREIFFELYDLGLPEGTNPIRSTETITVSDLSENTVFDIAFGSADEAPLYKIEFVLQQAGMAANATGSSYTVEQIAGDDTALVQYLPRNSAWTDIKIPRICTNENGFLCYFEVIESPNTMSRTYYATFEGLDKHDIDTNMDDEIDSTEVNVFMSMWNRYYGLNTSSGLYEIGNIHRNGRPHSADLNQDWMIDTNEAMVALGYWLRRYGIIESGRSEMNEKKYGFGDGFQVVK